MSKDLEILAEKEYPGRVIIIGKSPDNHDVIMYAITGRSPSSQARMMEVNEDQTEILVKPTDEETLKSGNPDLLIYPSIIIDSGIAVSNGKQTADIPPLFKDKAVPVIILVNALYNWEYESDEPNYTPRISGCLYNNGAALSIIKRVKDGPSIKNYYRIPEIPRIGWLIATYTGVNINPLPSFDTDPVDVDLPYTSTEEATVALYTALGPKHGKDDLRVAVATVFRDAVGKISITIKNRHEI